MTKRLLLTTVLVAAFLHSPANAADNDAMMAKLKAMQAQMLQMQKEMEGLKNELAKNRESAKTVTKVAEEIKAAKIAQSPESDIKITMSPAPKFETADGAYSFKIGGFAQFDAGHFEDDLRDHPDGTNVRRARLAATGVINTDFNYKIDYDFANNGTTAPIISGGLNDTYLQYTGLKPVSITIGFFRESFGLETLTSDTWTTFMERAIPFMFSPDRNIGLAVSTYGETSLGNYTATIGGFGARPNTVSTDDEAKDITARLTYTPLSESRNLLHLGVAGSHRIPDSATDDFRFQSRDENRFSSSQAIDTLNITNVDSVDLIGLEAANVYGPFSLQGEYVMAHVNRRRGFIDEDFSAYYVEASYFLTGEHKQYVASQGKFDRVKPKWGFKPSEGEWGAWQIAARYSAGDLNGKVVRGGELKDLTLGLRWIPHQNLMFLANYIHANTGRFATTPNDDPDIWMLRTQFDF